MEITLEIFYYAYLVMVGISFLFSFVVVWHLLRFGHFNISSIVFVCAYLVVAISILGFSWQIISKINWNEPIQITGGFQLNK
ncbi:hypothetical protein KKA15_02975 [Patescibacteria group bacterium]|nr:hypothetical protein [Patescibacteria group bacterium]